MYTKGAIVREGAQEYYYLFVSVVATFGRARTA